VVALFCYLIRTVLKFGILLRRVLAWYCICSADLRVTVRLRRSDGTLRRKRRAVGASGSCVYRLRLRTSWLPRHLHASVRLCTVDAACCRTILSIYTLSTITPRTVFDLIVHCYHQCRPTVLRSINQQRVSFVVVLYLYSISKKT